VSIQVDSFIQFPKHENQMSVGIDIGINKLATLSHGIAFEAPKPLRKLLWRLKRESRKLSKMNLGSHNYKKQCERIARLQLRIANIRNDTLHKVSTFLASRYSCIGLEDLHVKGMVRNHKLARSISDVGFGEFRRQIEYKVKRREGNVIFFDRFFPSSKKCSSCCIIKETLSLSERVFKCECGLIIDRDLNAAINLDSIPKVLREFTPVEMTALRKSVHPVSVTSITESGNKHQLLCG
jgi:putative transposase